MSIAQLAHILHRGLRPDPLDAARVAQPAQGLQVYQPYGGCVVGPGHGARYHGVKVYAVDGVFGHGVVQLVRNRLPHEEGGMPDEQDGHHGPHDDHRGDNPEYQRAVRVKAPVGGVGQQRRKPV